MKQGVKKGKKAREAYAKAKKDFVNGCRDLGIIVGKYTVLPTNRFDFTQGDNYGFLLYHFFFKKFVKVIFL